MAEYIKREDAIKAIHDEWDEVCNYDGSGHELANEMESVIDRVPAADVVPVVRGRWVRSEDADDGYCSNCKCDMPMCREDWEWKYCETDFCPNCGADMREVQR